MLECIKKRYNLTEEEALSLLRSNPQFTTALFFVSVLASGVIIKKILELAGGRNER